jgi:hypothetical protein
MPMMTNEPRRFGQLILPLTIAAPLMMSACAPQPPTYSLYDVQPGNGWYDERQVPVYGSRPPGYPPLYTYQVPQLSPAPPPRRFFNPDNGSVEPERNPPPDAGGDESGSSNSPPPIKAPAPPPDEHADGSPASRPMIDANPPGEKCGWWRLCNLWD